MTGGPELTSSLEKRLAAARDAASWMRQTTPQTRAQLLTDIADALDANGESLVAVAHQETHLAVPRLQGELTRTTFQLRLFAAEIEQGGQLDAHIDHADAAWPMGARPDLRRTRLPLGPVLVFAASNFPFAFGVVGGDTASAWAAGCPVVAKAHSYQPLLADAIATVVSAALARVGAHEGVYTVIHGRENGTAALVDSRIMAAGFTGSLGAGRALFDLANSRPVPIPFYGELSSLNPVFVTPAADRARGDQIAAGFAASFTLGAGQFCTKPGFLFVPAESEIPEVAARRARETASAEMLHSSLSAEYAKHLQSVMRVQGASVLTGDPAESSKAPAPSLVEIGLNDLLADPESVLIECFGPAAVIVRYPEGTDLATVAEVFDGQLTGSIFGEESDATDPDVKQLVDALALRAGRVLWNAWPTGVTVTWAQQHGGPYPATTAPATTSVGVAAITRYSRPVAFQGFPAALLPEELREASTCISRVDGFPVNVGSGG